MSTPPFTQEKAPDGKVRGQQPTLLGAEKVMYQNTRLDGRRTQHVGILGSQWTAHDRGVGDKGVPAAAKANYHETMHWHGAFPCDSERCN